MFNINITVISNFIKYFGSRKIEEKARETGFKKRSDGKLEVETFLKVFTVGLWGCHQALLPQVIEKCEEIQEGLSITKQAIHDRLKTGAGFLKEMLKEAMEYTLKYATKIEYSELLDNFGNIYIVDGTHQKLPDKLEKFYKGCGGTSKSKAVVKIQAIFNLTTRSLKDLQVREGKESDKCFKKDIIETLQEGDLVIQDLGYFSRNFFKGVSDKMAYYLSKIQTTTVFYEGPGTAEHKPLPLDKIFKKDETLVDINVYMGQDKKTRIPVRLVGSKLPPKEANERLRKAYKKNKNRNLTEHQKTLLSWNILITNAPLDKLPAKMVLELYRIRWQVEILFKSWKSHLGFKDISAYGGKDQFDCMLYGRLILITLLTMIFSSMYKLIMKNTGRELSILKFFSLLRDKAVKILEHINENRDGLLALCTTLSKTASKSLYEKRKRKTTLETVMEFSAYELEISGYA